MGGVCIDLAGEMGMSPTPTPRQPARDGSFLSTRLVVDTGMNALGWPREGDRVHARSPSSPTSRSTPNPALFADYHGRRWRQLGARKFHELREQARALDPAFDLPAFHAYVLGPGRCR
jgi:uncharacterized protein (DUF885 family)